MHVNKKRLHLYELPLQYHLQKRKESYELPAKSENQMQQEFLLPGSDDQGYSHALYKCPAISGVFHQKKGQVECGIHIAVFAFKFGKVYVLYRNVSLYELYFVACYLVCVIKLVCKIIAVRNHIY